MWYIIESYNVILFLIFISYKLYMNMNINLHFLKEVCGKKKEI